jgi:hypothetical protein
MAKLCADCKWFHASAFLRNTMGEQYGECHLHPPQPTNKAILFHHRNGQTWVQEYAFPIVDGTNPDTCSDAKFA